MLLQEGIQVSVFDERRWVINTPTGHNLLVNQATAQLFGILQKASSAEQAQAQFNAHFQASLSADAFAQLLHDRFGGYALLAYDPVAEKALAETYIKLRLELFSARAAALCAAPLRAFYTPLVFWPMLAGLLVFLLAVALRFSTQAEPVGRAYWVVLPLVYASLFVHEFGHIAACSRFGIRHGGVGFGLYLYVFPALYADVTNVWQANRQRRIITNLGGIFSQLFYAGLLAGAYLLSGYAPLLLGATATAAVALWQLNPFVRRDGYWLLADLTNTPNLLAKATQATKYGLSGAGWQRLVVSRGRVLASKRMLLFLYGLGNGALLLVFVGYTVARYGSQLVHFPQQVAELAGQLLAGSLTPSHLTQIQPVVFAFYLLLLRYAIVALGRAKTWPLPHYLKPHF